jgi:hypothetical protein
VRAMSGPPVNTLTPLVRRLSSVSKTFGKVKAPAELEHQHAIIASAWDLAHNAFRLRIESVSSNSVDVAQRASSAAAGALLLYQRARADQLAAMEPPPGK